MSLLKALAVIMPSCPVVINPDEYHCICHCVMNYSSNETRQCIYYICNYALSAKGDRSWVGCWGLPSYYLKDRPACSHAQLDQLSYPSYSLFRNTKCYHQTSMVVTSSQSSINERKPVTQSSIIHGCAATEY